MAYEIIRDGHTIEIEVYEKPNSHDFYEVHTNLDEPLLQLSSGKKYPSKIEINKYHMSFDEVAVALGKDVAEAIRSEYEEA